MTSLKEMWGRLLITNSYSDPNIIKLRRFCERNNLLELKHYEHLSSLIKKETDKRNNQTIYQFWFMENEATVKLRLIQTILKEWDIKEFEMFIGNENDFPHPFTDCDADDIYHNNYFERRTIKN